MFENSSITKLKSFLLERRLTFFVLVFFLLSGLYAWWIGFLGFKSGIVVFEALTSFFLFLVYTTILYRIHRYYHSRSAISIVHLGTLLVFTVSYLFIVYQYANLFFQYEKAYQHFLNESYLFRGIFTFLILLAVINQLWIDKHILDLEKRNQLYLENEKRLLQAELLNLKQQFQPHFLFNSLNSINALVITEPKEARRMILLLSDFLRLSIRKKDQDFVSLKDELEYLELYLEIEKVRFGHRLSVQFEITQELLEEQIPTQILQPLLENAIKYGLYGNTGNLLISLSVSKSGENLLIRITNPYEENAVNASQGTGFGLKSVEQKMKLVYGRTDLIEINQDGTVFRIKINIPII